MNERLKEINRSLRTLDEAHFHGRINRQEYRARRRHLLGVLCDSGGITARNTMTAKTVPRANLITPQEGHDEHEPTRPDKSPWWARLFSRRHEASPRD